MAIACEGWWSDTAGRQGWIGPARARLLDENSTSAVDRCHGGNDFQRPDLRSRASARSEDQWGSRAVAACDRSGREKNDQIDDAALETAQGKRGVGAGKFTLGA